MDLHADGAGVEADGGAIGAGAQSLADVLGRERVQRPRDLSVLVTGDLRVAPERDVVQRRGGGAQGRLLDRLEVFAGRAQGATVRRAPYSSWHQCRAWARACSRSASSSPAKQSSRTLATALSTRALSRARRTRVGSMTKPRA